MSSIFLRNRKAQALVGSITILFLLSFTNVIASASPQISFTGAVNLSNNAATATDPNVQASGNHVYVAWTQGSGGIYFRQSSDSGSSWASTIKISPSAGSTQYPLMSDNGSNVYVVWSQAVGSTGLQIFEATSQNYGASFNPAVQLTSGHAKSGYITPVIASWGSQVYVAYDNTTQGYAWITSSSKAGAAGSWTKPIEADSCPGNGPCPEPQVYAWGTYAYVVSDNGFIETSNSGASWKSVDIQGNYNYVMEPWVWGYGSNAYVVFETGGSRSDTMFTFTNNNGATWSTAVNIASGLPDTWNQQIGAHGNTVWVAVQEYPGGSKDTIYVYTSQNGGASFSKPIKVSTAGVSSYPFTIATTNGQNVFTAWSQKVASNHWVMDVAFATNGTNWSGPYNASNNPSGEAGNNNDVASGEIAASGSTVYVVWQYMGGSTSQIYFSKS